MSDNPPPLSKADRIAIGGAVAPIVRRQAEAPRVVTVVGKDGKPVRKTTSAEVAKAVLARSDIEFSVQEGKRPTVIVCEDCAAVARVPTAGRVHTRCRGCRSVRPFTLKITPDQQDALDAMVDQASAELSTALGISVRVSASYLIRQMLLRDAARLGLLS